MTYLHKCFIFVFTVCLLITALPSVVLADDSAYEYIDSLCDNVDEEKQKLKAMPDNELIKDWIEGTEERCKIRQKKLRAREKKIEAMSPEEKNAFFKKEWDQSLKREKEMNRQVEEIERQLGDSEAYLENTRPLKILLDLIFRRDSQPSPSSDADPQ